MSAKKFNILFCGLTLLLLLCFSVPTIIIDPYFHYHAPLESLNYPIDNERYQNDGMLKHFSYNAIIAGTSMAENFVPAEFDEIFGMDSIKVSFSGGSYKEVNNNVLVGLKRNKVTTVLRGLDYTFLDKDKDYMKYEKSYYPEYLYDNNIFNDVQYLWNKDIFELNWNVIDYSRKPVPEQEDISYKYGKKQVLESFQRAEETSEKATMNEADRERILENVRQNVTSTAELYPDVTFYLFFTPYSICYWDDVKRTGKLDYMVEAEKIAIEELLQYDNIRLFSFTDKFELTCDLEQYKDQGHYAPWINTEILKWIKAGEHELTKDNYCLYLDTIYTFYNNYDYDAIYE